jgi:hypothetical protein
VLAQQTVVFSHGLLNSCWHIKVAQVVVSKLEICSLVVLCQRTQTMGVDACLNTTFHRQLFSVATLRMALSFNLLENVAKVSVLVNAEQNFYQLCPQRHGSVSRVDH